MKKIVSNVLVVCVQLMVGGLFLCMLFSDNSKENKVVVAHNDNLNKMADSVSLLFSGDKILTFSDDGVEVELLSVEEVEAKKAKEAKEAEEKAKAEAEAKAKAEAEAKAAEEAARLAATSPVSQTIQELQNYAHSLVIGTYGWSEADFVALVNLWNKESGWDVHCYNSYSGAYGIPQSLPGSKMASEGSDYENNGETQIRWGLKYIQGRYGSPSAAWQHFLDVNWY